MFVHVIVNACFCILTDSVTNLEAVFWGPVIVDFAVIGWWDYPTMGASNFELKGRDWEIVKSAEYGKQEHN